MVGDSSHPTRAHLGDTTGVDCMHEFGFAGVGEDITNWFAELPNKATEKSRYGEEILDPTLENPDVPCPTEKAWKIEEATEEQGTIVVKGRLREHVDFWREVVKAPAFIIDCIQNGYKLPLFSEPPPHRLSNSASALKYKDFVSQAVAEHLRNGCIKKLESAPHVCSPLSVVVNTKGKKRLVINLHYLNQFLKKESFKYEDLRTLLTLLKTQDYLCKFDLKSGYHHVEITNLHWKYLGFQWGINNEQQYYVFTVLPFGLATACYVFTKLIRPLVKHWRGQELQAVVYLDDGIVAANGMEAARRASEMVKQDLARAGFVAHKEKS